MTPYRIPFNKPCLAGRELLYVAQAILQGHTSGDGGFTKRCHLFLENHYQSAKALLTTNCTHALEISALLLDIQPGDEVIVPSFTFVSTANAFALRGAKIVFADIRPDTLNLDETRWPSLITPRTRAVVPVHYAGVACEMDSILAAARQFNIAVVEDNAHGFLSRYRGRLLGTFGALAAQSFHETKNITCGEGGALLINDLPLAERAEIIREKGTNRSRFFRGQVDKYSWVGIGSSYLPSDILAAFLLAQLEEVQAIQQKRRRVWERYHAGLQSWAAAAAVQLPAVPPHCEQAYHMFYILLPSLAARTRLIEYLKQRSILAVFHYLPLHLSDMGLQFGGFPGQCPVTENISERLLRLPFFNDISPQEQDEVIGALCEFVP